MNPMNVIKTALMMLYTDEKQPLHLGDGRGRKGKRMDKKRGMRTAREIELERGVRILSN